MSTLITAIEIGSSKIIGAVGKITEDNSLTVVAVEEQPLAPGSVRYGCVANVEEVSSKLNIVKRLLENNTGVAPGKITSAYVALGGRSLASHPAEATRAFGQETEITESVVSELRNQVRRDKTLNKEVLDSVPLTYLIDGKKISMPVGTLGYQIRARYNLIVCDEKIKKNIKTAFDKIGLEIVAGMVLTLAVDSLILTKNQRELGCVIIDFGAETTTVAVYKDNTLKYLATIPMGSRLINTDLSSILNVTEERAEELKQSHVNLSSTIDEENTALDKTLDNIDYKQINNIVKARVSEIIANIQYQISQSHLKPEELTEGILLIGKGSRLNGFKDMLKKYTGMKIAYPSSNEHINFSSNLSVSMADAVDIVAVLGAVARSRHYVSCVEMPQPSPGPIIETEPEQEKKPNKSKDSQSKSTWADKLARTFMGMINTDDEYDAEDE